MAKSKIEWCDEVWNPVTGCTRASAGCDNCYAVTMTKRLEKMGNEKYTGLVNLGKNHFNGVIKTHEDTLIIPLKWKKPRRVFVNSMSDLFHPGVPFEFIDKVFAVAYHCPQHTFQALTKRPERAAEYLSIRETPLNWLVQRIKQNYDCAVIGDKVSVPFPLPNVWLGTSVENQEAADERIPHLLKCPAAVRFLSCEPLLGPIRFEKVPGFNKAGSAGRDMCDRLWVICGGESGPKARPMHPDWPRSLRDQCQAAGVPYFMKQIVEKGRRIPFDKWPADLKVREYPDA